LEGVVIKSKEKELLKNIRYGNQLSRQKEPIARAIRKFRQSAAKALYSLE